MQSANGLDMKYLIQLLLIIGGLSVGFAANARDKVTVFAASSLTNALTEIAADYEQQHNVEILFSFASSSTLARQISQGAPAQIYLSANQKWMDYLVEQEVVNSASRQTLLQNTLVLVASKQDKVSQIHLDSDWNIAARLNGSRLAVADPSHVPAGRYAVEALKNLGLWPQAKSLLARANNVRAALALVERGEAPLGIVYATDASVANHVEVVATFPSFSHQPIEYPMVLVESTPSQASVDFYNYLQSPAAKIIYKKYGFNEI